MALKDIIKKVKILPIEWEENMHIIYLMSIEYPEYLQLNYKKKTTSFF